MILTKMMKTKMTQTQVHAYCLKYLPLRVLRSIIILHQFRSHQDFYRVTGMKLEEGMMLDVLMSLQYPNHILKKVVQDGNTSRKTLSTQETKKRFGNQSMRSTCSNMDWILLVPGTTSIKISTSMHIVRRGSQRGSVRNELYFVAF